MNQETSAALKILSESFDFKDACHCSSFSDFVGDCREEMLSRGVCESFVNQVRWMQVYRRLYGSQGLVA